MPTWRPGSLPIGLAILALIGYLVIDFYAFPIRSRFPDEQRFINEAVVYATSGEFWTWRDRAFEMPLLGSIYGLIYGAVGSEAALIMCVRSMQAALLVAQAWLCADLSARLFGTLKAAPLAFIGVLVYPMFVVFQALLLSEALFTFLVVLGIWLLYRWNATGTVQWLGAYAVTMAAATYTKASLTWLPVLLPILMMRRPLSCRKAASVIIVTGLAYCACLSPWWIRNARVLDEPVLFTTSASSNLYLGNNAGNLTAGNDWETDVEPAFVAGVNTLPELERDRRFKERAMIYIRSEPGQFVLNALRKFVRFWNIVPNHDNYKDGAYRWIVASSYGPVLGLTLLAVVFYRSRWHYFLPIYALVLYLTLVHTVTIASLRYRLPLEPFLVIFAAGAVARLLPGQSTMRSISIDTSAGGIV